MLRSGEVFDIEEARNLVREYRAALPLCQNGALLKQELARLNLRVYELGLTLPDRSAAATKFQDVIDSTPHRTEQGGIYAPMDEAQNVRRWIDFLTELVSPSCELLSVLPKSEFPPCI